MKTRSMVGIIPALAAVVVAEDDLQRALTVGKGFADFLASHDMADPQKLSERGLLRGEPGQQRLLLSLCGPDRLERLLAKLFDENEFLSPYGLRALSAYHREHPYTLEVEGITASINYEPAESTTPMFGGNSNWRGPIWFPLNYLMVSVLERYHRFYGDDYTIEYPTGSGQRLTLDKVAADLSDRLISIFTNGPDGRRPCFGGTELHADQPRLARQLDLQRVLPRRQRRRDRRFPPDRVDRADRRPDPAPIWRGRAVGDVVRRAGRHSRAGGTRRRPWPPSPAAECRTAAPGSRSRWAPRPASTGGDELRGRLLRRRQRSRCACSTRLARKRRSRSGTTTPTSGTRSCRASAGAGLRVPGRRPVGPGAGAAVQPGQAAARPVREGDQRSGHVRARGARPGPGRPGQAERPGLRRARTAEPGRRRRVRLAGRQTALAPLRGLGRLRDPRQGLHNAPPGHPARAARDLRRAGPRGRHRVPDRPRRDRRRTAAGAPERARGVLARAGPDQLLGLQHDRLLRAAQRLFRRGPGRRPAARSRVQGDGRRAAPAGLEVVLDVVFNHTAEAGPDGPALCFRGIDNTAYYRIAGRPRRLRRHDRLRQLPQRRRPHHAAADAGLAALLGHRDARRRVPVRPGPHAGPPGRRVRQMVGVPGHGRAGSGGIAGQAGRRAMGRRPDGQLRPGPVPAAVAGVERQVPGQHARLLAQQPGRDRRVRHPVRRLGGLYGTTGRRPPPR